MKFKWFRRNFVKSKRKGGFPEWIVKTDEERIQNKTTMFNIEDAVGNVLDQNLRTADIMSEGMNRVGTVEMGQAVVAALN